MRTGLNQQHGLFGAMAGPGREVETRGPATAGEDRWLALAVRDEREWSRLAALVGKPEWADDAELRTAAGRRARIGEIDACVAAWAAGLDRDDAAERLVAAGVPASPLLELEERNEHPHWVARGLTVPHDYEGFDPCTIYATPWHLTASPPQVVRPTPTLGEHNDYVYRDLLGLDAATIARLQEEGVLV